MKPLRTFAALALLLHPTAMAMAQTAGHADAVRKQQEAAADARLAAVKQQIAALAQAQRQTAAQRSMLDGQIAQASQALAAAATQRAAADAAVAAGLRQLGMLQTQVDAQQARVAQQRAALAALLRAAYALGPDSDLRVLLGDADLARVARALAYAQVLQRQRLQHIDALRTALQQLQQRHQQLAAAQQQLVRDQAAAKAGEQAQQTARERLQALRARADARYRNQAQQLAALAQQRRDLEQLLARLRDIFADIPKQLPGNVPFVQLKGRLPWPIAGRARSWQGGLLIDPGGGHSRVRAVANGRVAWADWLRGFGMLVVVDQGDGWISLYGNNESLLVRVGDWVTPGQVIANAGSAAAGFDGAWFALRHDGRPVDPRGWLARGRR